MGVGRVLLLVAAAACLCSAAPPRACRRHLRPLSHRPGLAFVFGGVGPLAAGNGWRKYYMPRNFFKCLAAVESLVKVAGWGGDAYLLTNKDNECFDQERITQLTRMGNVKVLKVYGADDPLATATAGGSLKTDMFSHLPAHIDTVVWHDCDVVWARPDCIGEMLEDVPTFDEKHIFYFGSDGDKIAEGRRLPGNVHVGSFVAHRKWSMPLLDAWRAELKPHKIDYECLKSAFAKHPHLHEASHAAPMRWLDHMYGDAARLRSTLLGKPWPANPHVLHGEGCVNHITGMRCRQKDTLRPRIPKLLHSLCLDTFLPPADENATEGVLVDDWCAAHKEPLRLLRACVRQQPSQKLQEDAGAVRKKR